MAIGTESKGRRTRLGHSMWWRGRVSVFSLVSGPGTRWVVNLSSESGTKLEAQVWVEDDEHKNNSPM